MTSADQEKLYLRHDLAADTILRPLENIVSLHVAGGTRQVHIQSITVRYTIEDTSETPEQMENYHPFVPDKKPDHGPTGC